MLRILTFICLLVTLSFSSTLTASAQQDRKADRQKRNKTASNRNTNNDRSQQDGRQKGKQGRNNQNRNAQQPMSAQMQERMIERFFKRNDKDSDGFLTETEVPERQRQQFARIDKNKDQKIDKSEMATALNQRARRARQPGAPNSKPVDKKSQKRKGDMQDMRKGSDRSSVQVLRAMDKNRDGEIAMDEASDRLKQRFSDFDLDGNAILDKSELAAMTKTISKTMRGDSRARQKTDLKPKMPKRPPIDG